jgi:hypothetical protein
MRKIDLGNLSVYLALFSVGIFLVLGGWFSKDIDGVLWGIFWLWGVGVFLLTVWATNSNRADEPQEVMKK